ncbi:MAG: glycogen/starch synthase [Microscillaceae bacterium]|nr:glycogen/starch synthase [Microscillaceae bacterium]
MEKLRILYVASEINPFLKTSKVAEFVRKLPQAMQEKGMEIRILVPRFGLINERKNRLHEVVRLSGINISVGDDEKPLVIKVASIPNAKLQVYFIDNEDYFHRKYVFKDKEGNFYLDNDERIIFFCKGVLETVKKLGWAPHIVHCNDWITSLIPMYLKTTYSKDPVFNNTKCIYTVFNNYFNHKFEENLIEKVRMLDNEENMLEILNSQDFEGFSRLAIEYSDVIVKAEKSYDEKVLNLLQEFQGRKDITQIETSSEYSDLYYDLYNEIVGVE